MMSHYYTQRRSRTHDDKSLRLQSQYPESHVEVVGAFNAPCFAQPPSKTGFIHSWLGHIPAPSSTLDPPLETTPSDDTTSGFRSSWRPHNLPPNSPKLMYKGHPQRCSPTLFVQDDPPLSASSQLEDEWSSPDLLD